MDDRSRATGVGFPTTLWSEVVSASKGSPEALATLARRYRPVVVKLVGWYLKSRGPRGFDPEDLTQDFFLSLLERPAAMLARADRSKGKFRAWLRSCLRNWLHDWSDRSGAKKRGGRAVHVAIQGGSGSGTALRLAARDDLEREFDRQWAKDVFDRATVRLKADPETKPVDVRVWELKFHGTDPSDREIAVQLGIEENTVVVALRRAKRRFRALLESEIRATVCSPKDLEEELRELRQALAP